MKRSALSVYDISLSAFHQSGLSEFSARMRDLQDLKDAIDREIQSITGLRMEIELVEPMTLERFVGKAVRVVDHRREKGLI